MAKGNLLITSDNNKYLTAIPAYTVVRIPGTAGNVTSSPSTTEHVAEVAGNITAINLSVGTNGVDVTNPLSLSLQITNLRTGLTLASTAPKIDKTAGTGFQTTTGFTTASAPTGITVAALQNLAVLPGDILKCVWTLTRTASPGTEIADAGAFAVITQQQDFDPAVGS